MGSVNNVMMSIDIMLSIVFLFLLLIFILYGEYFKIKTKHT